MIDWDVREEEIKSMLSEDLFKSIKIHAIIIEEQAIFAKLEADKAELLEALKALYNHTKNQMQICGINQTAKELIQKMEESKCPTCNGEGGHYDDETGFETCPDCRGKGVEI